MFIKLANDKFIKVKSVDGDLFGVTIECTIDEASEFYKDFTVENLNEVGLCLSSTDKIDKIFTDRQISTFSYGNGEAFYSFSKIDKTKERLQEISEALSSNKADITDIQMAIAELYESIGG